MEEKLLKENSLKQLMMKCILCASECNDKKATVIHTYHNRFREYKINELCSDNNLMERNHE